MLQAQGLRSNVNVISLARSMNSQAARSFWGAAIAHTSRNDRARVLCWRDSR